MKRRLTLLPILGLGLLIPGCQQSAPTPTLDTRQAHILGGYVDDTDKAVVGLVSYQGRGYGTCSGTLITPNIVLTAQHCIAPVVNEVNGGVVCGYTEFGSPYDPGSLYATTKTDIEDGNDGFYAVSEVIVPPDVGLCGHDIAILILQDFIPELEAIPYPPRVDEAVNTDPFGLSPQGETYSAAGYGQEGDGWGSGPSGIRRRRDNLTAVCEGNACGQPDSLYVQEWLGDEGVCSGDSGGPALDAQNRVIGVVSRGAPGCESPVYTSVFGWRDWIMSVVKTKSQDSGFVVPEWADGGSSDPSTSWPVGGPCNDNNGCYSGICIDGYCSRMCTEEAPCPDGYACSPDDGYCVLPPVGTPCEDDTSCEGGVCVDGMCTRPCVDSAPCPDGFICEDDTGLCGLIPLGDPCAGALDCATLMCVGGYCTRTCDEATACPQPFACSDGICLIAPIGDSCIEDVDCPSNICVDALCTRRCDEMACDTPWTCDESTELCVPPPEPEEAPVDDTCPVEPCDEPDGIGGGPAIPGGLPCVGLDCDEPKAPDADAMDPSGSEACIGEDCAEPADGDVGTAEDGPMELSAGSSSGCAAGGGLDGALWGLFLLAAGLIRRRRQA